MLQGGVVSFYTLVVAVVIVILYLLNCIKILREYERAVVFTLGRLQMPDKGPGLIFVFAPLQKMVRVDLRQQALEVPPQDIITRDNVTLKVNAVVYWQVLNAAQAVVQVQNYYWQTQQFAQTTLRSVLGEVDLDELLAHRDKLNARIQAILDQHTSPYGVKVANVEIKQVDLPDSMQRAMAKQAEAEREKRAKIIHAEGEFAASQRLADAAKTLATEPLTLQLRYLQTLTEIGVEKNTTIVFPLPVDILSALTEALKRMGSGISGK
jgi:regulator of protease activity HflC (stomatin/prohibitin superfamily)